MKNIYTYIFFLILLVFHDTGAETNLEHGRKKMDRGSYFESEKASGNTPRQPIEKNPISTYCGPDCINCGFSKTQCLAVLGKYFSTLCQNQPALDIKIISEKKHGAAEFKVLESMRPDQNCFVIWQRYAETCSRLCGDT